MFALVEKSELKETGFIGKKCKIVSNLIADLKIGKNLSLLFTYC